MTKLMHCLCKQLTARQVTEFPNSSLINKNESDREQEHLDAAPDWAKGSLEKQAD